jgi:hypothetical protein
MGCADRHRSDRRAHRLRGLAKSIDLGASWSDVVVDHTNAGTDKAILAVRGKNVYVA